MSFKEFLLEDSDENLNQLLQTMSKNWEKDGVKSFMYAKNGDITLSEIRIAKENRGKGLGTLKMKELLQFAQEKGLRILLTPSKDFGASSKSRLEKFYKRFGFKKNSGRSKDFTTQETMIWTPQ